MTCIAGRRKDGNGKESVVDIDTSDSSDKVPPRACLSLKSKASKSKKSMKVDGKNKSILNFCKVSSIFMFRRCCAWKGLEDNRKYCEN